MRARREAGLGGHRAWLLAREHLGRAPRRRVGLIARGLILAAVAALALAAMSGLTPEWVAPAREAGRAGLLAACLLYALCLAVPFVPSVEIGLLIMVVFGKPGAVGAYLATLAGLNLAYLAGRLLGGGIDPERVRLSAGMEARLRRLARHLPGAALPVAALAVLLNLPANTALGGGGGIALAYGATRALGWPTFAATVALATALVPALFLAGVLGAAHVL